MRRTIRKRKLPFPFVPKKVTSWQHWGEQCKMINACRDAMRKWCKGKGIDFSKLPPIVPPTPPSTGERPFGPVRDVQYSAGFNAWDYALS